MENTISNIKKDTKVSKITVEKVEIPKFQKGNRLQATLRQTITRISMYPSARISNSLNGNIFKLSDFGLIDKIFETKDYRVTWIDVPEGSTVESVTKQLEKYPKAHLYKILSNYPILTSQEEYAIRNGDITKDQKANSQVVRYPMDYPDPMLAGKLIFDGHGKVQYRRIAFDPDGNIADIDDRNGDSTKFYASQEIAAEINMRQPHILADQSIS